MKKELNVEEPGVPVRKPMNKIARDNHVRGVSISADNREVRTNLAIQKLEIRRRTRDELPEDSEWCHKKYDSAYKLQLMSDDDDEYDMIQSTSKSISINRRSRGRSRK
jgi:hypothetical protein